MRERVLIGLVGCALVGCAAFLLFAAGVVHGAAEVRAEWRKEKQDIAGAEALAVQKRIAENEIKQARINQLNNQLEKQYVDEKSRIAHVRRLADAGLRNVKATNCGQGSAIVASSKGAKVHDSVPASADALSDDRLRALFDVLQRADEVTAQCRALQTFITENGLVSDD